MFNKKYDIVICGGGIAGIAAAVTCARAGATTCLVEKTIIPGGLATSGLINIYLPLCDGNGNQILGGVAEELLGLSVKYGPGAVPAGWGECNGERVGRYMTSFSPASFVLALDEMLDGYGIDLWYDTLVYGARLSDDNRLTAVEIVNKSGQGILSAHTFIDATGDADVANFAGCELHEGENFLSIWALQAAMNRAESAFNQSDLSFLLDVIRIGADDRGEGHPDGEKIWKGISGKSVSRFSVTARRYLREYYKEIAKTASNGSANVRPFPLALPSMPQLRKTRRIVGRETVNKPVVGCDLDGGENLVPDWRCSGKLWQIPIGALIPVGVDGLYVAGRIISAENDAWDACRVIPVAAFTGEMAGKLAVSSLGKMPVPLES